MRHSFSYKAVFSFSRLFAARYARTNNREKLGLVAKTRRIRRVHRVNKNTTAGSFRKNTLTYSYAELRKQLHFRAFNSNVRKLTNSIPSGKVASFRSLLGKRWITFPFTSSKRKQQGRDRETSKGITCFYSIFIRKSETLGKWITVYHSLSPCLFHKRQNNQQDGTFLLLECHVGNHAHTPFPLDAILVWVERIRHSLDMRRCGCVIGWSASLRD